MDLLKEMHFMFRLFGPILHEQTHAEYNVQLRTASHNTEQPACREPEHRVQNTEYRGQSTEYRVQSTEYGVQSTEYSVQSTESALVTGTYIIHRDVAVDSRSCYGLPGLETIIMASLSI